MDEKPDKYPRGSHGDGKPLTPPKSSGLPYVVIKKKPRRKGAQHDDGWPDWPKPGDKKADT